MKKISLLVFASLLIISCSGNGSKDTMIVNGNVKGLKKGTLYLQHLIDTTLTTVDSLEIAGDGAFQLETELESPEVFYLYLKKDDANDINDRITFFGEPGTITINTSWNTFDMSPEISGSETQKKLEEYQKTMSRFNMRNLEILREASNTEKPLDSLQLDSLQLLSNKNLKRGYAYALNFALNHRDSYIAPYIALNEVSDANVIYLDSIYKVLSPEVAESKYGKKLKEHLETIKQ